MLTKLAITLTPKQSTTAPAVVVSIPGHKVYETLQESKRIELEFNESYGWLQVDFSNKPDNDQHMAVIIDKVEFFGISDPRFIWAGIYTPNYPEPWYSQQIEKPPTYHLQQNYLGWNGTWRLDFSIPVFTWMHRVQNLGWIYQ
jgi:hypothetical protein